MSTRHVLRVTATSAVLVLLGSGIAYAALDGSVAARSTDGATDSAVQASHANHKHGGQAGHLPGSSENMRLVGQMRVNQDVEGRVADVSVHNGYAYVAAFNARDCQKGGVYVFDVRKPEAPKQINFIRTANNSYVGEGTHAIALDLPAFRGDLLVHNNERCTGGGNNKGLDRSIGGITMIDVSNPKSHRVLSRISDTSIDATGHEVHSAFAWQPDATTAYAAMVDNRETTDIDIVDISDPRRPVIVAEYDLNTGTKVVDGVEGASGIPTVADDVKGDSESFLHDMVVKEIDGRWTMLASYWDGGYVTLDVTDVRNATYIADSDFAAVDEQLLEQTGESRVPEGNAHQAEFNTANTHILAADEDFSPYGFTASGTQVGAFSASSGDNTPQLATGVPLTGETVYVGRACTGDAPVPAGSNGQLALVERGVCSFQEKVANIARAGGYAGVVVFNRTDAGGCDSTTGMTLTGTLPTFGVIARSVGYQILGVKGYDPTACLATRTQDSVGDPYTPIAAIGTKGDTLTFESYFDGWGYLRLFKNGTGKLEQLDTYAIPEAFDPAKAQGFGDLSVHEVAYSQKDPDLAYVSYYAGGTRVVRIVDDKIVDSGHWIDASGSNVWGVDVFQSGGKEYVAASDRDYGIQIFEYTGPGKVNP